MPFGMTSMTPSTIAAVDHEPVRDEVGEEDIGDQEEQRHAEHRAEQMAAPADDDGEEEQHREVEIEGGRPGELHDGAEECGCDAGAGGGDHERGEAHPARADAERLRRLGADCGNAQCAAIGGAPYPHVQRERSATDRGDHHGEHRDAAHATSAKVRETECGCR